MWVLNIGGWQRRDVGVEGGRNAAYVWRGSNLCLTAAEEWMEGLLGLFSFALENSRDISKLDARRRRRRKRRG